MESPKPNLTLWKKEDYPDGTVGKVVFPDVLDQRWRLPDALMEPSIDYIVGFRDNQFLTELSLAKIGDLLKFPDDDLLDLVRNRSDYLEKTHENVRYLLRNKGFSPDDRLMAAIYGKLELEEVITEKPEDEEERGMAIRKVLSELASIRTIGFNGVRIIRSRYGLDDWILKSDEEVSRVLGLNIGTVRQKRAAALRAMRHPSRSAKIYDYLPKSQP